jgi:hypothetical protein
VCVCSWSVLAAEVCGDVVVLGLVLVMVSVTVVMVCMFLWCF